MLPISPFSLSHATRSSRFVSNFQEEQCTPVLIPSQIIPASYNNEAKRIKIPDLPPEIIPASPEGIKTAAPPSGFVTPIPGVGSGLASPLNFGSGPGTPEPPASGYKTPEDSENLSLRMHDVV
jgi:hypothetical protein